MISRMQVGCLTLLCMLMILLYDTIPRSVNPIENFEFECRLNKELCGIDEWLKVNKLSLNVNKSKYMLFNAGNKTLYPFEIKIDYISIERV